MSQNSIERTFTQPKQFYVHYLLTTRSYKDSSHLEAMLLENTLDIALMQIPGQSQSWDIRELAPIDSVAVISSHYTAMLAGKTLQFADLSGAPLIPATPDRWRRSL